MMGVVLKNHRTRCKAMELDSQARGLMGSFQKETICQLRYKTGCERVDDAHANYEEYEVDLGGVQSTSISSSMIMKLCVLRVRPVNDGREVSRQRETIE